MDLFIGLSGPGIIQPEALGKMNDDAIVFAMANPNPEVMPEDAAPYVRIMATGRSDYPNQINNVLCFPGIFRGALDAGAPRITEEMKLAAAKGIAEAVTEEDLSEDYIIPSVFNRDVAPTVAEAVVEEAKRDGIARFNEETGTFSTVEVDDLAVEVLVTGASGFIGSALCDSLLVRGDEVVGLTRDPQAARSTNPAVAWHAWEPTLERPPAEAFEGVDGVVNLLGEKIDQRWTEESKRADHGEPADRHPQPGRRRSRRWSASPGCWSAGPRSASTAIAARRSSTSRRSPARASTPRSCASGRRPRARSRRPACGWSIVRTGHVLDPRGGLLKELLPPFKLGVGGPIAGGRQYMSWIHVDDEVGILLWALDNETVSGTINATAPNPVTNRELSKALGRALGRPAVVPSPRLRARLEIRPRVRAGAARWAAGRAAAGARPRLRVPASRPGRGPGRPALGERGPSSAVTAGVVRPMPADCPSRRLAGSL